jgi:hypothetical protein
VNGAMAALCVAGLSRPTAIHSFTLLSCSHAIDWSRRGRLHSQSRRKQLIKLAFFSAVTRCALRRTGGKQVLLSTGTGPASASGAPGCLTRVCVPTNASRQLRRRSAAASSLARLHPRV